MSDDTQALAVGLGVGLGGFAGLLIIGCICWQICCGSWCVKKSAETRVKLLPVRCQRNITTVTKVLNDSISTMIPMKSTNIDLKPTLISGNDLASRVKSSHQ
ncbi:unnamed protein product [Rotaria magnacalcarata]|uniref:Uncharacterized protein n=1 Tax=Rotaria magnacalcarata TaxID=392030 RepID=A0A816XF35_9BILA|nr:unnamed protein product [Rotaria magnacalcarata]CAF1379795.1 unnamed protein product [Rotaria magnacalcarata]CAF2044839.1 unnamed protein product [Rotaria magnacalcarata]CAF2074764.1 unnamed protein product [Rotaria magnacalcarata]CAF2145787.1 unnamed protein product [Rotaria magnacalcarata]